MLSYYKAVTDFVVASQVARSDPCTELQEKQTLHLMAAFRNMMPTMEDAAVTLQELAMTTTAFSDAQRRELAHLVSSVASEAGSVAGSATTLRTLTQTHMYMYNYLTEDEWALLQGPSSVQNKNVAMIDRRLSIGLTHPTEPTVVSIMSIIGVASGQGLTPMEAYNAQRDFKAILKVKRTAAKHVVTTMRVFPSDVVEYNTMHPGRYPALQPPTRSHIDIAAVEERRLSTAARRTHKTLSVHAAMAQHPTAASMPGGFSWQALPAMIAQTMLQLQGAQQGCAEGLSNLVLTPPRRMNTPVQICTPRQEWIAPWHGRNSPEQSAPKAILAPQEGPDGADADSGPGLPSPCPLVNVEEESDAAVEPVQKRNLDDMIQQMQGAIAGAKETAAKAKGKEKAKGKAGPKAKGKAKSKAGAKAAAKANSKAGAKAEVKGKDKDAGAAPAVKLGCGKCRGARVGCVQCRDPSFRGARWQK